MFKNYKEIKDQLSHLASRRDQYQLLLQTNEWMNFRQSVLSRDSYKCRLCNKPEGPIYAPLMSNEEYSHMVSRIDHENRLRKQFSRNLNKVWQEYMTNKMNTVPRSWIDEFIDRDQWPPELITMIDSMIEMSAISGTSELSISDFMIYSLGFGSPRPIYLNQKQISTIVLQAHHKLYYWDKLPWQYERRHLLTLCVECHSEVHQRETIYVYRDETMKLRKILSVCGKCQGTGYLPEYYYRDNGVCYDCGGAGMEMEGANNWEQVPDSEA